MEDTLQQILDSTDEGLSSADTRQMVNTQVLSNIKQSCQQVLKAS